MHGGNDKEMPRSERGHSADISIPIEAESAPRFCLDCQREGVVRTAHAGHDHHQHHGGVQPSDVKPELAVVSGRTLGTLERAGCVVSGIGWAGLAATIFAIDWISGHVLDGLLLDFIYVTAGIVAYFQFKNAYAGRLVGPTNYKEVKQKVMQHFNVYKDWLFDKLGWNKKA